MKNEKIQSRREFFKEAAKKALPVIGAIALTGSPVVVKALESHDCNGGCYTGCYNGCSGSCKGICSRACEYGCTGCSGSCYGSCKGSCSAQCAKGVM